MKTTRKTMNPCFAFYDSTGLGFLMYQDANGRPVAEGVKALEAWRRLGCPHVSSYSHAQQLGIV